MIDRSLRGACHEGSDHEKNPTNRTDTGDGWSVMMELKAIFPGTTNFDFEGLSQRVLAQAERHSPT